MRSLLVRTVLATLILPGNVAVVFPAAVFWASGGWRRPAPFAWPTLAGAALILLGLVLGLWTMWLFAMRGRGTPAPWDPPRRLVVAGPYRLSRNPMYVGVLLILAGEATLFTSWYLAAYALLIAISFHLRVVYWEEPVLVRQFGEEFAMYRKKVPRWLRPPVPDSGK